jgi:hypothetical protein
MFIEWIWSHNKPYKNFENNIIQFLGVAKKKIFYSPFDWILVFFRLKINTTTCIILIWTTQMFFI